MRVIVNAFGPHGFGAYQVDWADGQPVLALSQAEPELILTPGFVDLHIHGAFGIDFMSASAVQLLELCGRLAELGYEGFLPTTVSAGSDAVLSALKNLPEHPMILGVYVEGPFISPLHPGAQPPSAIEKPPRSPSAWDAVLMDPRLKLITLAPEAEGASELIRTLRARGFRVSMGHTDATYEQSKEGFEDGVRHVTHTFNAMRGFHHREPGAAGFALLEDGLTAELIYDRLHVSAPAAALLLRCKPVDRVVAVSDSSLATGMPDGQTFTMWGHEVETGDGSVRIKSSGALAGSTITLLDAFRNLGSDFGAETAIRLCCLNPRKVLEMRLNPSLYLLFDQKLNLVEVRHAEA